jgi:xylose dehydrogenase (NAD/NADP)
MAALAHGKHVICEKPLGLDAEEAALMFDAADAAGLILVEAYWHLWHPRFALAKSLIAAGTIGEVISINSGFTHQSDFATNFRSNESQGGGMLLDLACYPISAATYILDLPVLTRPLILEREPKSEGVELHVKATADLGPVSLTVTASSMREADRWFDVLGTTGSISLEHPAFSSAPEPTSGTVLICTVDDVDQEWHIPASDPRSLMVAEVAIAVTALRDGTEPQWSFRPNAKLSILTAHAIDVLKKAERPVH